MLSSKNKLDKFRNQMQSLDLDACLVNQTDEFQNEFLPNYSQRLQWLTNFSGSAGEVLITHNQAYLFVDGRYTLQAKIEVNQKIYKIYNYNERKPIDVLNSIKLKKINFGIDGNIITTNKLKLINLTINLH